MFFILNKYPRKVEFLEKFPENSGTDFDPFYLLKVFLPPEFIIVQNTLKISGKISLVALTPLYRHRKYPILRGDTGGRSPRGVPPYPYIVGRGCG